MKSSPNITGESKTLLVNNYNRNQSNKSDPIAYWCFICNSLEHKIFDYPHCQATQDMFKDKGSPMEPKKKPPTINMVLAMTIRSRAPKMKVFKENEPWKTKTIIDWTKKEKLYKSFEIAIKQI